MTTATQIVHAAICNTKTSSPDYWRLLVSMRSGKRVKSGSAYELLPTEIETVLLQAHWEPYEHQEVAEDGCAAFQTRMVGLCGHRRLSQLSNDTKVMLTDPCRIGYLKAEFAGNCEHVWRTVLVVEQNSHPGVVLDFFPGEPREPARVLARGNVGHVVTAAEAVKLGLVWAKVVGQ